VIQEFRDMEAAGADVEVICDARVYEVMLDKANKQAKGARFVKGDAPDKPCTSEGDCVILSCGAVQTARLLWMSGPPSGLGNSSRQLGRNATFHLVGMSAKAVFKEDFQGLLHGEFGHTGNVTSFEP
jgi:choline dehydrogenase-like flavoprotein